IREYSLTQDIAILEDLNCDCKEEWEKVLELDGLTFGCPIKS
ncbi:MAG: radical SAM protein, partial [Methanohalophilus sp. T328-1]